MAKELKMKTGMKTQVTPVRTGEQNPGNDREASAEFIGGAADRPSGAYNFFGSQDGRNDHPAREKVQDHGHSKPTLGDY